LSNQPDLPCPRSTKVKTKTKQSIIYQQNPTNLHLLASATESTLVLQALNFPEQISFVAFKGLLDLLHGYDSSNFTVSIISSYLGVTM
jgi:hypothetical protein